MAGSDKFGWEHSWWVSISHCLSFNDVECLLVSWNNILHHLCNVFYASKKLRILLKIKFPDFLWFLKLCYTVPVLWVISQFLETKQAFNNKNEFCCLWWFHQSQWLPKSRHYCMCLHFRQNHRILPQLKMKTVNFSNTSLASLLMATSTHSSNSNTMPSNIMNAKQYNHFPINWGSTVNKMKLFQTPWKWCAQILIQSKWTEGGFYNSGSQKTDSFTNSS